MSQLPAPKPTVASLLEQYKPQLVHCLPKYMSADRMIRVSLSEFRKNPELQKCDPLSFCSAVMQAGQLGLDLGGALGEAWLVPYGHEVQLSIGYRGYLKQARKSKEVKDIYAHCVFEGDTFSCALGTAPIVVHEPKFQSPNMTHVYAVFLSATGGIDIEIMCKDEVDAHRQKFAKATSKAWANNYNEMAKKTVLRRLIKRVPMTAELIETVDYENQKYNVIEAEPAPEKYQALVEAEDIPSDAEIKAVRAKFESLVIDADVHGAKTSDLYANPSDLSTCSIPKLRAICDVLQTRINDALKK